MHYTDALEHSLATPPHVHVYTWATCVPMHMRLHIHMRLHMHVRLYMRIRLHRASLTSSPSVLSGFTLRSSPHSVPPTTATRTLLSSFRKWRRASYRPSHCRARRGTPLRPSSESGLLARYAAVTTLEPSCVRPGRTLRTRIRRHAPPRHAPVPQHSRLQARPPAMPMLTKAAMGSCRHPSHPRDRQHAQRNAVSLER